jgi:type III restriction enzyme
VTTANPGQVIDGNPIINDAFVEPVKHWYFAGLVPELREGRRPSGYLAPSPDGQLKISDELIDLTTVNDIRNRVRQWRMDEYPGVTHITRELFKYWWDDSRKLVNNRPFFAQQEAVETIVFLTEAPEHLKVGINIPDAGETFTRWAVKMATGTGKTLVMSLLIAWSGLNKTASRNDLRFTDQFLVVCPNVTVRERLAGSGGLDPKNPESAYISFDLIPPQFKSMLGQLKVQVMNWHQLAPKEDPKSSVLKRGKESDAAFARRVLTDLSPNGRILVLNDEAHHAYRFPENTKISASDQEEAREATIWIDGLTRIGNVRELIRVLDFSATPMYPGIFKDKAWMPFEWIVSDFALVDAIESGLVKIPRTPTDDNTEEAVPKYRNLWSYIKDSLPKRGQGEESSHPMMDYLAEADGPLKQLAGEWEETFNSWSEAKRNVPPVLIVICHDTTVAKLLEKHIAELGEASPLLVNRKGKEPVTVRIDSDALAKAETGLTTKDSEQVRELVATVGKVGKPGEQIRCLVSVAMLSEGWDARNVTHILGLRAFASQLLCEQVVGRGLRRSDYSDLSQPEFVDIYGVPFQLLPMAKATGGKPTPPPSYTNVHTINERNEMKIEFPRLIQVVPDIRDVLDVDFDAIEPIKVNPSLDPTDTYVEFDLGKAHAGMSGTVQDREKAYENFRIQRLLYRVAAGLIQPFERPWLFPQALSIAEKVIKPVSEGGKIDYASNVDPREICNLRYLTVIRERLASALRAGEGEERFLPSLDEYEPIGTTDSQNFAAPTDRCVQTVKSHLSHAVCDSILERKIAAVLDETSSVHSWVKNHRLHLEIPYMYMGISRHYRPDFIVKLNSGITVLLEGKGVADEKDDSKSTAARRWVEAVNSWGKLGTWTYAVCYDPNTLQEELESLAVKV